MIKICPDCKENHQSKYSRCRPCYYRNVTLAKISVKFCVECNKEFKKFGEKCFSCMKKQRYENYSNKICKRCKKNKIHYRGLQLCGNCYDQIKDLEVPGYKEKRLKSQRDTERKRKGIDINLPKLRGEAGTGHINKAGYRIITKVGHPNSHPKKGAIPEHVFVMSEFLKRPLKVGENIHHKNGIRHDNRIENLELWSKSQPCGQRVEDKIRYCKDFLIEYGYKISEP